MAVLAINRLCDPGTDFAVHRRWFLNSAMDELLGVDFAAAAKDRLYRCLDRILPHKDDLCRHGLFAVVAESAHSRLPWDTPSDLTPTAPVR